MLIVDAQSLLREAYTRTLEAAGYDVTSLAGADAVRGQLHEQDFDAAVLDYTPPEGSSEELVELLLAASSLCKSLVVTRARGEGAAKMLGLGAHAYLCKPIEDSCLLAQVASTVRATHAWRQALGQESDWGQETKQAEESEPISFDLRHALARLRFVAQLSPIQTVTAWRILWGDPDRRIAELLGCSQRTVKYHVSQVLARTGARSRQDLLRVLMEDAGIVDPWSSTPGDEDGQAQQAKRTSCEDGPAKSPQRPSALEFGEGSERSERDDGPLGDQ